MTQHQNAYEIDPLNYITRHVSLHVVEENEEEVLSPYFLNGYSKIIRAGDIFFSVVLFIVFLVCIPFVWLANQLFSPGPYFTGKPRR